ncbi:hypothetical protein VTL71DRAFT_12323 [Oculimacula yallundae]|uniref:Peptidase A1 domain-containing protein n=1 Tax=Oculimacula yallundae TaxID=86028 RepID=A0ABR4CM91_9HELO
MSLLPSGILTLIDSTVPEIWLPLSACSVFETTFGLQYDPRTDRYLVNETIHNNLTTMNPPLSFKLGNLAEGGQSINIVLPYKAFDLQASWLIYDNITKYFPLRRALNESQYTLGRRVLQEAYVIADYERSNFSVSQRLFKDANPQNLVAILPPITRVEKPEFKTTTLVAIIISIIIALALFASGIFIFIRIRNKRRQKQAVVDNSSGADDDQFRGSLTAEALHNSQVYEVSNVKPVEMSAIEVVPEMVGTEGDLAHELLTRERLVELSCEHHRR